MPSNPRLKLTYFDIKARAEPIRLALFIGDIDFEDERITFEQFKDVKPSLPFGQLPILKINDDLVLTQSSAIARYCAKLAKLYPDDSLQAAKVDEFIGACDDFSEEISKSIHVEHEQKQKMRHEFSNNFYPRWLNYIEKLLSQNRFDYCVGDSLTLADLYLYTHMDYLVSGILEQVPGDLACKKEQIRKHFDMIKSNKKICQWNDKHASKSPQI